MALLWNLMWLLLLLKLSFCDQPRPLLDQLIRLGLTTDSGVDPCVNECTCYNWEAIDKLGNPEKRFTVNCTGLKYGLYQTTNVPKNVPFNTTDLVLSKYLLGTLNMASFPNQAFPLNPLFRSVSLENCHIVFLSSDTFQGNSFVSIKNISLGHNSIELLVEGTFRHLPNVENISVNSNHLQKVHSQAFRNLPRVHAINLSHNAISEIQLGAFGNLPLLDTLDLSHNWLTTIPVFDILQLPSLRTLDLKGNFWNCSCEMSRILELNYSVLVESRAMCLHPLNLNGTAMHQLTMQDFQHCFESDPDDTYMYTYTGLVLCLSFICTCIYLVYYHNMFPDPKHSNLQVIGQIEYNPRNVIGRGVFGGKLRRDGCHAAIKILPKLSKENCKELESLLRIAEKGPLNHVIQYLWFEEDSVNTYIALELCRGDLKNAIANRVEEVIPCLTPEHCLLQLTHGLNYVHQSKIQHRDIKPPNILWKYSGVYSNEIRFVISDFDLSQGNDEASLHKSRYGTLGWAAPELWNSEKGRRNSAVDIFALGCVFYYVLTLGEHPFGSVADPKTCQSNIDECNFSRSLSGLNKHCSVSVAALATDVITKMIQQNGSDRPEACVILEHPLLWNSEIILKFFCKIGSYMENKGPSVNRLKDMLEHNARTVFEGSWMEKLEKSVRNDVKGFKDQRNEICALLRVIRNKIVHFRHLREELREIYLGSPEGFVQYYNERFPMLLMYTYYIEQEWAKGL